MSALHKGPEEEHHGLFARIAFPMVIFLAATSLIDALFRFIRWIANP